MQEEVLEKVLFNVLIFVTNFIESACAKTLIRETILKGAYNLNLLYSTKYEQRKRKHYNKHCCNVYIQNLITKSNNPLIVLWISLSSFFVWFELFS